MLQEWRFLLAAWPLDKAASEALFASVQDWLGTNTLSGDQWQGDRYDLVALLYAEADLMEDEEVCGALIKLGVSASEAMNLASSMQKHRSSMRTDVRAMPLLFFLDSALAQVCSFYSVDAHLGADGDAGVPW